MGGGYDLVKFVSGFEHYNSHPNIVISYSWLLSGYHACTENINPLRKHTFIHIASEWLPANSVTFLYLFKAPWNISTSDILNLNLSMKNKKSWQLNYLGLSKNNWLTLDLFQSMQSLSQTIVSLCFICVLYKTDTHTQFVDKTEKEESVTSLHSTSKMVVT